MSFAEGGFLADFTDIFQFWHDRGVRMFKFDFVDFDAATPRNLYAVIGHEQNGIFFHLEEDDE